MRFNACMQVSQWIGFSPCGFVCLGRKGAMGVCTCGQTNIVGSQPGYYWSRPVTQRSFSDVPAVTSVCGAARATFDPKRRRDIGTTRLIN